MKAEESICFNLKNAWLAVARMYNQLGLEHDVSAAIGYVLLKIDEKKGTPATKIGPLAGLEATSLTRMLKSLEEKKLILRKPDDNDKRSVRVYLTEEGKKKKEISKKTVKAFNKEVRKLVSEKKLNAFFEVLERVNEIAENTSDNFLDQRSSKNNT
jgi:MarR family transcriptional regulator, organic hydroperoxide resistance regulator